MVNWKQLRKNIPNRVQVNRNVFYEVLWIDEFKDGQTLGETRFHERQIVIINGLSAKKAVTTYLHELAHAVSMEHEVDLTENQILSLESSFYYVLKSGNVFGGIK